MKMKSLCGTILAAAIAPSAIVAKSVAVAEDAVPDAYRAQWNDKVNAEIDARIEKWRKADGVFQVGAPSGTNVKVEQVSHAFQFGSHIFNFDQLGRDDWNDEYKAVFTNLWNAATVPFYWREMEPSEGAIRYGSGPRDGAAFWNSVGEMSAKDKAQFTEYRRPAPDPILDFCEANGISPHGHVMIYPPFHPAWTTNGVDAAALAERYERRIQQLGMHYGDRLPQWDVVNESVDRSCTMAGPFHDKVCWSRPNMLVPDDYTFRSYKWAAGSFPRDVKFVINDSWRDIYVPFVQQLIDRGAKIDIVGIQMHIFRADQARKIAAGEPCLANGTSWAPEDQIAMLRKLDTLGRPIHLSEITIPASGDSSEGLARQARLARDNYRLWFSWPSIYRITWWNMVDYTYHKESLASGLFTKDMEKKPVYYALDKLINYEWRTRLSVKADEQGRIFFRGFRGKYRLSWEDSAGEKHAKFVEVN